MRNINFMTALSEANLFYDVNLSDDEFIEIGMVAWDKIGNKAYRVYRYTAKPIDDTIILPCNCDAVEAVFIDCLPYDNMENIGDARNSNYNAEWYSKSESNNDPLSFNGTLLNNYIQEADKLRFHECINKPVTILYKGWILDECELPYLNSLEVTAIATYVAFVYYQKLAFKNKDQGSMTLAQSLRNDWRIALTKARQPEIVSQNDLNKLLNVATASKRKQHNKSFNVI